MTALHPGTRLGPYEVVSLIGAGGMGEVYRARDTRLDRSVALKVLAPTLAPDAEARTRFTREARAISALSHPHICGLYDIGRERDIDYLVLELLDGVTLAERLGRGALPLQDVYRFGIEIADALAAAHMRGIIHRDLRPGNILITRGGAKLLDFGLAKGAVPLGGAADDLRTVTGTSGTGSGTMIGTPQYMAPEQVTGGPADARTDIFAFGAVLHEMTTGRRVFEATSQAGVVAKILEGEVPVVSTLAPGAPFTLDFLIQRCLAKEPAERWQSAHDIKLQLQAIRTQGSHPDATRLSGTLARRTWVPWSLAALAAGLFVARVFLEPSQRAPEAQMPARLEVTMPSHMRIDSIDTAEISPDGRKVAIGALVQGRYRLFMRDLASAKVTSLGDMEATRPFWSPDSQFVGFFASGKLMRSAIGGGPPRELCDAKERSVIASATWGRGVILYAASDGSIVQVPDTGGSPTRVATLPWEPGKLTFDWPQFLPDGRRFLVTRVGDPAPHVASLDEPGLEKLSHDGSRADFGAGHLLFFRGSGAYARAFDPARGEFMGPEVLLAERADFLSVSNTGRVLYGVGQIVPSRLTWFDRGGRPIGHIGEVGEYRQMVLSPLGKRVTVVQSDPRRPERNWELWDVELATGNFSKLTTDPAGGSDPAWSPDERQLAFTSVRSGTGGVYIKDINTGTEKPLVLRDEIVTVDEWTPDGKFIIFRNQGRAVWSLAIAGDRTEEKLIDTPELEDEVHVSPNGRWVAFNSDRSGTWQVDVARFPDFTSRRQISGSGGVQPQWRRDGRELFYLALDGSLMAVPFTEAGPVGVRPSVLFRTGFEVNPSEPQYAVSRDGARFLGLERLAGPPASLVVLLDGLTTPSPQ
jgi:eukaryotic-like serine/threonine-protein kinase